MITLLIVWSFSVQILVHGDLQQVHWRGDTVTCTPSGGLRRPVPWCLLKDAHHRWLAVNDACYCLCERVQCSGSVGRGVVRVRILEPGPVGVYDPGSSLP